MTAPPSPSPRASRSPMPMPVPLPGPGRSPEPVVISDNRTLRQVVKRHHDFLLPSMDFRVCQPDNWQDVLEQLKDYVVALERCLSPSTSLENKAVPPFIPVSTGVSNKSPSASAPTTPLASSRPWTDLSPLLGSLPDVPRSSSSPTPPTTTPKRPSPRPTTTPRSVSDWVAAQETSPPTRPHRSFAPPGTVSELPPGLLHLAATKGRGVLPGSPSSTAVITAAEICAFKMHQQVDEQERE